jgi:hypothetical protein
MIALRKRDSQDPAGSFYRDRAVSAPGVFVFLVTLAASVATAFLTSRAEPAIAIVLIAVYLLF